MITHYADGNVTAFKAELMGIRLAMGIFLLLTNSDDMTTSIVDEKMTFYDDDFLNIILQPTAD